jgi:hypothetical protein
VGLKEKSNLSRGGDAFKGNVACHGKASEKRVVKSLGMQLTPSSGAMEGCKSDGKNAEFRVECKSTVTGTMSLKHDWLCKIAHEARETCLEPALTISFINEGGVPKKDGDWVMITKQMFRELTEK